MAIKAKSKGDTLELELYGVVGDGWSEDGIVASRVRRALKDAGEVAFINMTVSSIGGLVDEGNEIYQMISDHPAKVTCTVGAQAISCGSLIAIAADERILHASSIWCSHNPWRLTIGDYKATEKSAAELKMLANVFAQAYSEKTGKSVEEIQALMDEDRYMDADEALSWGFATKILDAKKKPCASGVAKAAARSQFEAMKTEASERMKRFAAMSLRSVGEATEQASALEIECARTRTNSLIRQI